VVVAGFSGLGKSTLLMQLAFNAWASGYTPLYISLEMEAKAILRKFDAMAGSLDYRKLKNFDLPDARRSRTGARRRARSRTRRATFPSSTRSATARRITSSPRRSATSPTRDRGLPESHAVKLAQHRGVSMWQALTEITQDLKQNARTLNIPVVAAAQTNRAGGKDGAELDNIGYSLSVVQDSDIFLGLFQDDELRENKEMELSIKKNRDGRLGEIRLRWDYGVMHFGDKNPFERLQDTPEAQRDLAEKVVSKTALLDKPAKARPGRKKPGT
jgi:replicative DNA helicase